MDTRLTELYDILRVTAEHRLRSDPDYYFTDKAMTSAIHKPVRSAYLLDAVDYFGPWISDDNRL